MPRSLNPDVSHGHSVDISVISIPGSDWDRAKRKVSKWKSAEVVQTFPDEQNPKLQTMYVIKVNPRFVGRLLGILNAPGVASYAQRAGERFLASQP